MKPRTKPCMMLFGGPVDINSQSADCVSNAKGVRSEIQS